VLALFAFSVLLFTGVFKYLPYHLAFLYHRGVYYMYGNEQIEVSAVQQAASSLLGALKATTGSGIGQEL